MSNPAELLNIAKHIAATLPKSVWSTTTPATLFRIANNRAEYVPNDYTPQQGDLVFLYKNDDGYISILQTYPPKEIQ